MRSKKSGNKTPHFPLPNSLISNSQSKVVMSNSPTQNPSPENMQTLKTLQKTTLQTPKQDFLTIKDVSKVYETPKGPYVVLDGVNLTINEGEFICLIGHSGCGKSTLLNMIAGFNGPTNGEVALQGSRITEPGPDRMVVFQNYSLLPWLTATENIHLGVENVYPEKSADEHNTIVKEHLELVGLTEACNKRPGQLSGGMKQRVAIARALATRPKLLILDEPFGALDPITREELQEELLKIWRKEKITVIMITHDIDEALFLADRIVMMTNGPAASIGEDMHVPFSRPRNRARIMEDPKYYELRNFALEFLFSRYAHHEEGEATDSETEAVALPMPLPASKKPALAETANKPIAPAPFVANPAEPPEASPVKRGILAASWFAAMVTLAAVNMSGISSQLKQAKLAETAPQAATAAAVVSSPPSPQIAASSIAPNASPAPVAAASPAPVAASPAPIAASPAPIAASPAPVAAASPAPIAAASPAPVAASPAPVAAAANSVAPNAATSATSEISDQAELNAIGEKLYAQIDQTWRTTPTFTESLTYRVKVKQNGDILQFDPTNKAAKDFVKETPLPVLQTPAGAAAGAEKTAEFQVTFSPSNGGVFEVKSGK
ncbi:nitrate ABC transporter, ATPase subunits C and D [Oscillatoria nigro-viridis PCC 7112]|uniref:Nitrate ABC transporter, ATPase subunits C and D n=2 Tax=Phormidium nigroviride TaxID=482564 RepID=K9VQR6_9CYAN|nr:nitrate ABC transporter, ATPase subunits C and D [Oscillatoria nigro-viridis PCC 7112]